MYDFFDLANALISQLSVYTSSNFRIILVPAFVRSSTSLRRISFVWCATMELQFQFRNLHFISISIFLSLVRPGLSDQFLSFQTNLFLSAKNHNHHKNPCSINSWSDRDGQTKFPHFQIFKPAHFQIRFFFFNPTTINTCIKIIIPNKGIIFIHISLSFPPSRNSP
jgi:hypothetical protein